MQTQSKTRTDDYQQFLFDTGRLIQDARKARGLTQEQLAEIADMDRVGVGYIEQGRRAPKLSTLYKISKALGVQPAELIAGVDVTVCRS